MAKFRKRPIVIEAMQLQWGTWNEMCDFAGVGKLEDGKPQGTYVDANGAATDSVPPDPARIGLLIPTLEGLMLGVQDDWIIRGIKGELYPCKDEIFRASYEPVEEVI